MNTSGRKTFGGLFLLVIFLLTSGSSIASSVDERLEDFLEGAYLKHWAVDRAKDTGSFVGAEIGDTANTDYAWVIYTVASNIEVYYEGGYFQNDFAIFPAMNTDLGAPLYIIAFSQNREVLGLVSFEDPLRLRFLDASDPEYYFDINADLSITMSAASAIPAPSSMVGEVLEKGRCIWNVLTDGLDITSWRDIAGFCCRFDTMSADLLQMLKVATDVGVCIAGGVLTSWGSCTLASIQIGTWIAHEDCRPSWMTTCFASTPPTDCESSISDGQTLSGTWTSSCSSTHRSGRYAKFYTFSLSGTSTVQIDLTSSTDTFLYLLSGSSSSGSVIASNDDGGNGYNSRISRSLSAGTYTIEATTYSSGRTGSFSVSLQTSGTPPPPPTDCESSISVGQTLSGTWTSSCSSTHRSGRYAKFYTFSLSGTSTVQIDLTSSTDTFLYLLSGSSSSGSVIASNDDGGNGYNSRISRSLSAGTYTIEATTYSSGRTGSFSVSLQ